MRWFPIVLVVAGNVVYHLGQRAIPAGANPIVATLAAYVAALVATAAMIPLLARDVILRTAWHDLNYSTVLVAIGAVAIEIGFLLAYRAGWQISTASLTANAGVAVIAVALGALFFREPITAGRLAGVALCLGGLWLVTRPAA